MARFGYICSLLLLTFEKAVVARDRITPALEFVDSFLAKPVDQIESFKSVAIITTKSNYEDLHNQLIADAVKKQGNIFTWVNVIDGDNMYIGFNR